jgi:mandelamide amidase
MISLDGAQLLEAARQADLSRRSGQPLGRLHGLPVPVKDSINTHRLPTTSGTGALRGFMPKEDAPLIRRLTGEGGLVLGKTNIMEMSLGWTSNNKIYGAVRNPYDVTRIPGGSSGGSGAAVAARLAPLAIGEDTLGSIRVPAALCGNCGLRPTVGRYPSSGIMPITPRWDAPGPMARHVADLILFDAAILGRAAPSDATPLAGTRMGLPPEYLVGMDPDAEDVIDAATRTLERAGVTLVRAALPEVFQGARRLVSAVQAFEIIGNQMRYLQDSGSSVRFEELLAGMSPAVQARYHSDFLPGGANAISEQTRDEMLARIERMREGMRAYFSEHRISVLASPPTLSAALPIGQDVETEIGGVKLPLSEVMARNVAHGSAVGMPCLVLPAGLTRAGLPVGLSFDMLPGQDEALLSLGLALEKVLGPLPAPPPRR